MSRTVSGTPPVDENTRAYIAWNPGETNVVRSVESVGLNNASVPLEGNRTKEWHQVTLQCGKTQLKLTWEFRATISCKPESVRGQEFRLFVLQTSIPAYWYGASDVWTQFRHKVGQVHEEHLREAIEQTEQFRTLVKTQELDPRAQQIFFERIRG